jgi:hypothetical protein
MKTCKTCKKTLSLSLFGKDIAKSGNIVYRPYCKSCRAEKGRNDRAYRTHKVCNCCGKDYKVLGGGAKKKLTLCGECYPTYRTAYSLWHACLSRAKDKNIEFDLDMNEIHMTLANGKCVKTGHEFVIKEKGRNYKDRSPFAPSIDKIDPSKGYTKDNIQVVCWWYNSAKGRYTDEEVLELCKAVVNHNS